ncbi:class I SAM-dependent methyltransferase [Candidatus Nomurabacteria bacterium]|nr:class I SAM-dependent methyltransferase [Candidatus Nomurabacteria bacterium]
MKVEDINTLSYTDFVGLIAQWNVPPGAFSTLSQWRAFGEVTSSSNILEAACTTGFSLREMSVMTGCSGIGVDISKRSIETAQSLKEEYAPGADISFQAGDALAYTVKQEFTHIIIGAALRFFPDSTIALEHLLSMLKDGGYLLSSEFYCHKAIPQKLVSEARKVFGIEVTQVNYKEVMQPYRNLTLIYESRNTPVPETTEDLDYYCNSTIEKFSQQHPTITDDVLLTMRTRLMEIKQMSNKLREYQKYNILVHKKDSRYYPHRYTELF